MCGPRLAHKIEKMMFEYNRPVGIVNTIGDFMGDTVSEMKMLASDADSVMFRREQNRNDNDEQHKKFVKIYGNELKQCLAFHELSKV